MKRDTLAVETILTHINSNRPISVCISSDCPSLLRQYDVMLSFILNQPSVRAEMRKANLDTATFDVLPCKGITRWGTSYLSTWVLMRQ